MKILFLITKSNFGGAQRYVYELATALPPAQYETVVAFGGEGKLAQKLRKAGIRTAHISNFQRDISITKEIAAIAELWRLIRRERPDVIHLNSSKAGGIGALVARLCGVRRIIYTTHGWAFLERRSMVWRTGVWLASWLTALLCHRVILVSQYEYRHTRMPFVKHKCEVIHTALPEILFATRADARAQLFPSAIREQHASDVWLTTLAELTPNKNLVTAIDAVAAYNHAHEQKIFYSIFGEGEQHAELTARINECRMDAYITLEGYVENVRAYLSAFDFFLLPSHKEGMPYAVLEAGAAGVPVIASNVGGIPEIIRQDVTGLLFTPTDTDALVAALDQLVADPQRRQRLGAALKEHVRGTFSLDRMIAQTLTLYAN